MVAPREAKRWAAMHRLPPRLLLFFVSVLACTPEVPSLGVLDCLASCRENVQRPGFSGAPEPLLKLGFQGSQVRASGPLAVGATLSLLGAERIEPASEPGVVSLVLDPVQHVVRLDFTPPVDLSAVDVITVWLEKQDRFAASHLAFAGPTEEPDLSPGLRIHFDYRVGRRRGVVRLDPRNRPARPIGSLALHLGQPEIERGVKEFRVEVGEIGFWRAPNPVALAALLERTPPGARPGGQGAPLASLDRFEIASETRPALYAPTPSSCACTLDVADPAFLLVDFALPEASSGWVPDGVTFSVSAQTESGGETPLWSRRLDPQRREADRGWQEARVPLDGLAGERPRLEFRTCAGECDEPDEARKVHALWSNLEVYQHSGTRPSVLLISMDTTRADRLSCYGYERETAPHLAALAKEGVLFESAIAQAPETLRSHASLFTGLYPSEHRAGSRLGLPRGVPNLVQRFREAGYRTAAITEDGKLATSFGFDRAFQSYYEGKPDVEETMRRAKRWLADHGGRPFFLFVHSYQSHTPYDAPQATIERFDGGRRPNVRPPLHGAKIAELLRADDFQQNLDEISVVYDAGVRELDDRLADLIDFARRRGLLEETLVVVFADHGEDLGDHFAVAHHGHSLYDELIRVPLVMAGPGLDAVRGRRLPDPVQLVDVLPSLLDLLGIPFEADSVSGRSFAPLLRGEEREESDAYSELVGGATWRALRGSVGGVVYKLIHMPSGNPALGMHEEFRRFPGFRGTPSEWELYRPDADPGERQDLAASSPDVVAALKSRMPELRRRVREARRERAVRIDPETAKQLRALGYADPRQ